MTKLAAAVFLLFAVPLGALAQSAASSSRDHDQFTTSMQDLTRAHQHGKKIPLIRAGALGGRNGIALGFQGYVEANPFENFGVYAIVGRTGVGGYKTEDSGNPVTADMRNILGGVGFLARSPEMKHFLRIGGFAQAMYSGRHVDASYVVSYPDPATGQLVRYTGTYKDSDRNPLTTIGAHFELRPPAGPTYIVRLGKNFGDQLASTTGGGIYFAAGPVFNPVSVARGVRHLF